METQVQKLLSDSVRTLDRYTEKIDQLENSPDLCYSHDQLDLYIDAYYGKILSILSMASLRDSNIVATQAYDKFTHMIEYQEETTDTATWELIGAILNYYRREMEV